MSTSMIFGLIGLLIIWLLLVGLMIYDKNRNKKAR